MKPRIYTDTSVLGGCEDDAFQRGELTLVLSELTVRELEAAPEQLIDAGAIPEKAAEDAGHIAIAVTNGIDYLVTWNCRHIANATMRSRIERVCRNAGYEPTIICTPDELMEPDDENNNE